MLFRFLLIVSLLLASVEGAPLINRRNDSLPMHTTPAGSTATSHYHKLVKRCWNKVIPGHPTLARVVVAGTFFILAAVIAGLFLFFYIYCRHKDEYADLEEGLLSRRRCFKPQLEDVEAGLPTYKTTPAVPFIRAPLRTFWRTEKEDDDSDNSEDDDSYTRSKKTFQGLANILGRKTRAKMRDNDEDDRQFDDGDLRKMGKDRTMTEVKEKLKTEQKRSSDKSDPLKKKDKGDHKKKDGETSKKDSKSARKTEKLQKKSEEYKQAKPAKQEKKQKILKEIKMAKRPKLKKLKTIMLKKNIKTKIRRKKR